MASLITIEEKESTIIFHIDENSGTEKEVEVSRKMCELFAAVNSVYDKPTIQLPGEENA